MLRSNCVEEGVSRNGLGRNYQELSLGPKPFEMLFPVPSVAIPG